MSCQKVLSLLSAYSDGEVAAVDADLIKKHLAMCGSCSREFELLRRATGMLSAASEVEPPAFLLQQIEAATVKRPGFRARLQAALAARRWAPGYAGWVAASAVAVGLLLATLISLPHGRQVTHPRTVTAHSSHAKPAPALPVVETPVHAATVAAAPSRTPALPRRSPRIVTRATGSRRTVPAVPKSPGSHAAPAVTANVVTESPTEPDDVIESDDVSPPDVIPTVVVVVEENEDVQVRTVTAPPKDKVEVAVANSDLDARLKKQADELDQLREKIARSRNRNRGARGIESRSYSVDLATISF